MKALLSFALLALLLGGCSFSREIVNPHVRDIRTDWIVPGTTTRAEVIARIGMPPTAKGLGGVRPDSFRWTASDSATGTLEAGYVLTPTFQRKREHYVDDILIRFTPDDVVSLVSRTTVINGKRELVDYREARK